MAVPWGAQGFTPVRDFIKAAETQGCVLRTSRFDIATPWGMKKVRYLHNAQTGGAYDMSDYADDEFMSPSSVHAAERRLGIKVI